MTLKSLGQDAGIVPMKWYVAQEATFLGELRTCCQETAMWRCRSAASLNFLPREANSKFNFTSRAWQRLSPEEERAVGRTAESNLGGTD